MKKIILLLAIILLIVGGWISFLAYSYIYDDNVKDIENNKHQVYVKTGWNYDSLLTAIEPRLENVNSFLRVAERMNLKNKVIPGLYEFNDNVSNRALISMFRSGASKEVKVALTGSLLRSQILPKIAENLEVDSLSLMKLMSDRKFLDSLGYNSENWPCLFMAETYFFNWATDARHVVARFEAEHKAFWNAERLKQLSSTGLTKNEVVILASIVDGETMMDSELKLIAGVYLNRLRQDWPLGADPTIRYLVTEQGRQRVLYADLKIVSPYNTYKNIGLPPGPILIPSVSAIDAVLQAESTEFMFFCAKADFSGYHAFAKTNAQHERNRSAYTKAMDARGIMR